MNADHEIRQLPHALGPEKSVLSSLFKGDWTLEESPLPIHAELFYLPAHRILFEDFASAGKTWELVSTCQRLHDNEALDLVGGPAGLTDVFTYAPNGHHFVQHLEMLRDRHARRLAIAAATGAMEAAYDCSDGDSYLQALSGPVTAVFDAAAAVEAPRDTKALAREFLASYERRLNGEEVAMGIPFGIPEIDHNLRGIHPGHFGIISGRSGGGKSTLATQIASNLATDSVPTLYLPLERGDVSIFERSVIQQAGVHHGVVKDPRGHASMDGRTKPLVEELRAVRGAVERITHHLFVRKPPNRRLATIVAEIRRYHRRHSIKVAFVDHIALIRGERVKGDTGEAELRGISNTLQELGHELGICIVVLSQVTEDADTKGARAIEEDADWWLHIAQERDKKKENYGEHLYVLIAKDSHNSKTGERLPLILNKGNLRFVHGFPAPQDEPVRKGRFQPQFPGHKPPKS
ncbi:hypothetical protein OKA04_15795 [Luteolibacter flavescens]|uniref:DNA 5'-3' helicase n=1 Tax=Luteolibacter flavescens TaxID=1859460 RepID=A0ABT3FRH8_9BACT|nr:DnaB-like helicase C-terminal domain-containing protein [Luteolibacter flavescens]MCW1886201.1 hypothetical protein [Luteolibacter flavescens]